MTTNKRYKLLRWFPTLPKDWEAGMELGKGDRNYSYSPTSGKYTDLYLGDDMVERNPEWFEEVIETPQPKERIKVKKVRDYLDDSQVATVVETNQRIPQDKFPAIKKGIEQILNDECLIMPESTLDKWSQLQKEKAAFNAARETTANWVKLAIKYGQVKHLTFQDYKQSQSLLLKEGTPTSNPVLFTEEEIRQMIRGINDGAKGYDTRSYLYSELQKLLGQKQASLKEEKGDGFIRNVYNSMKFKTNAGEELYLCMRDSGYEIKYGETWWEFKNGEVKALPNKTITVKQECPVGMRVTPSKEDKPKEWEIITWTSPEGATSVLISGSYEGNLKAGYQIRSVKRLSDGEVFTVGDKVSFPPMDGSTHVSFQIHEFIVNGHRCIAQAAPSTKHYCTITQLNKA